MDSLLKEGIRMLSQVFTNARSEAVDIVTATAAATERRGDR